MNSAIHPVAVTPLPDESLDLFGTATAPALAPSGIDFRKLWAAIRRNRWLMIAAVTLALLLGIVGTLLTTPRFTAYSSVQIDQETARVLQSQDVEPVAAYSDADRFLQTQTDVLRSRAMALRVLSDLGLRKGTSFFTRMRAKVPEVPLGQQPDQFMDQALVELLGDNLSINLPRESRVVTIGFNSPDARLAADVANAYAQGYIAYNLERKYDSSAYARNFLSNQLSGAKARLEASERDLTAYARAARLIRTSDPVANGDSQGTARSVTTASLIQQNQAANAAKTARVAAEERWRGVADKPALDITEVQSNPAIQQLLTARAAKMADLRQQLAIHQVDYPDVKTLKAQVDELDQQLKSLANGIKQSIRTAYTVAQQQERELTGQVANLTGETLSEQDRGVRFGILQREADTNRTLYDGLLQRYKEVSAQAGITSNNVSLVDRATAPSRPTSPKLFTNLIVSLLAGFAIAGALTFIREQVDDTVRLPQDVEQKLGLHLLGIVPKIDGGDVVELLRQPRSNISEAYHALRTSLLYSSTAGLPRTILLTSTQPGEGKSTTSYALANDLAQLGYNVALVDVDLRRPSLHRYFDLEGGQLGLSSVLTRQAELADVALPQPRDVGRLSLIPAGPIPPSPTELLGSPRMTELLAQWTEQYDVVLLDGPPVLGLADSAILAAQAQVTLFVIEADRGHHGTSKGAIRRLQAANGRLLGAVMTKFDPKKAGTYGYYYGDDYYYYGTSEGDAKARGR